MSSPLLRLAAALERHSNLESFDDRTRPWRHRLSTNPLSKMFKRKTNNAEQATGSNEMDQPTSGDAPCTEHASSPPSKKKLLKGFKFWKSKDASKLKSERNSQSTRPSIREIVVDAPPRTESDNHQPGGIIATSNEGDPSVQDGPALGQGVLYPRTNDAAPTTGNSAHSRVASQTGEQHESLEILRDLNLSRSVAPSEGSMRLTTGVGSSRIAKIFMTKTVTRFDLQVEGNKTVFLPGEHVDGQITLSLCAATDVKLVRVRFAGYIVANKRRVEVSFLEQVVPSDTTATIFKELHTYIGSDVSSDPQVALSAGDHVYPFSFRVPAAHLPASFEGNHGAVRYEVSAVLIRNGHPNRTCCTMLTVPSTVDVSEPEYARPIEVHARVPIGMWKWQGGHMDIITRIPRKAYTSDDVIPIGLTILNNSIAGAKVREISLKQKVIYRLDNDHRRGPITEKIHKLDFSETYSPDTRSVSRMINFAVPGANVLAPSIRTSVIDVRHYLCIKVSTMSPSNARRAAQMERTRSQQGSSSQSHNPPSMERSATHTFGCTGEEEFEGRASEDSAHANVGQGSTFAVPPSRPVDSGPPRTNRIVAGPNRTAKIVIPIIIAGFPIIPMDVDPFRISMDALPMYSAKPMAGERVLESEYEEPSETEPDATVITGDEITAIDEAELYAIPIGEVQMLSEIIDTHPETESAFGSPELLSGSVEEIGNVDEHVELLEVPVDIQDGPAHSNAWDALKEELDAYCHARHSSDPDMRLQNLEIVNVGDKGTTIQDAGSVRDAIGTLFKKNSVHGSQ